MSLKVVNLGLPKSGATTLARALRRGSLSCADHRIIPCVGCIEKTEFYVGELMYHGLFDLGDPAAYLDGFDTVSERRVLRAGRSLWPQTDFAIIDALRRLHPELRFVATRRDPFEMSQSMLAWSNLEEQLQQAEIPGLPAGFGDTTKAQTQWIERHYAHLRALFEGSDRFLELDVSAPDPRARLTDLLGTGLPWWGRINTNPLTNEGERL